MRKSFCALIILSVLLSLPAFAQEWDDFSNLDRAWDGQKSITNKEFEEVMDALQEKGKKKEEKQRKKKFKKISGGGTSLHSELNPDKEITEIPEVKPKEDGILVNLPVNLIVDGKPMEKGFYKVFGERDKETGKIYITFYQSQFLKGKIEVTETQDDFGEENLDFARMLPFNDSFVKMIFGSIDFNAYALVPYIDLESEKR